METRVYIRTRTRTRDYRWITDVPPRDWWREFGDLVRYETPHLIVIGDGRGWRALLGGIPTTRLDTSSTIIGVDLVIEGACDSGDRTWALALLNEWRAEIGCESEGEVRKAIDRAITEPEIARWEEDANAACAGILPVLRRFLAAGAVPPVDAGNEWRPPGSVEIAGAASVTIGPRARAAIAALLSGQVRGAVITANLFGWDDDADALEHLLAQMHRKTGQPGGSPWLVLVNGPLPGEPVVLERRKLPEAESRPKAGAPPPVWRMGPTGCGLLALLAVAALIVTIALLRP